MCVCVCTCVCVLCSDGSGVEGEGEVRGRGRQQQRKRRGGGRNSIGKHVKRRRGRRGVENDEDQESMMEDSSSVVELYRCVCYMWP